MRAPKLSPEAIADLRADVINGSLWQRYSDGRIVVVHDSGMSFGLIRIRRVDETMRRVAWVHINKTELVTKYKPYTTPTP